MTDAEKEVIEASLAFPKGWLDGSLPAGKENWRASEALCWRWSQAVLALKKEREAK